MFFVRFIVLLFLFAYSFAMGRVPSNELNGFGKLIASSFFLVAPALYLLPTFEAWKREHPNLTAISLVNIFLGWSLLGWVVAAVWAHKRAEPTVVRVEAPAATPDATQGPARATKRCHFCAEDVLAEAIKCKHCGSDLGPT